MTGNVNIINAHEDSVIIEAIKVLEAGGIVVYPTDTVYGLLVDATNEKAVENLINLKNRVPGKAISVFVSDRNMMDSIVEVEAKHSAMLDKMLPGPFTVVLPSKHSVVKLLESEKGTLGVRLIDFEPVQKLVKAFKKPITATSANLAGRSPNYSVHALMNQLPKAKKELISLIVDGGNLPHNQPSTVLDLTQPTLKVLRAGDIVMTESKSYISTSPEQTAKVGAYIADNFIKPLKGSPVVCVLEGDLGAGKTAFVKGLASNFNISNIVSPTFVVYYEYEILDSEYKKFIHADLYNIEEKEEFQYLGLEEYLQNGAVMCIEWGEKLGQLYTKFQMKSKVIYINIKYVSDTEREIIIKS